LEFGFSRVRLEKTQPHPHPPYHAKLCLEIIHMKTKRKFTVVIEQDEDGYYVATVPALRGCHTQAKTLDTLMKRVREVVQLCLQEDDRIGSPHAAPSTHFS
jgi:predicted RNase H-like HicB family nuclease